MANNTIRRFWNQYSMVNIEDLRGSAFMDEYGGHTFEISGTDGNGNTVPLSGTVSAIFLRPDNTDVAIIGSVSSGKAYITLTDECYAIPGNFGLTVFLSDGGHKTAIYAAVGSVHRSSSGEVSPGTAETVEELIEAIEAAIAAIPLDYSKLSEDVISINNMLRGGKDFVDLSVFTTYAAQSVSDVIWIQDPLYDISKVNTFQFRAVTGTLNIYLVTVDENRELVSYTSITSVTTTSAENGTIKTIPLAVSLGANQYIGVNGNFAILNEVPSYYKDWNINISTGVPSVKQTQLIMYTAYQDNVVADDYDDIAEINSKVFGGADQVDLTAYSYGTNNLTNVTVNELLYPIGKVNRLQFIAVTGTLNVYKIEIVNETKDTVLKYKLIKTITNRASENGLVKTVYIDETLGRGQYIGVSGYAAFTNSAPGHSAWSFSSSTGERVDATDGQLILYKVFYEGALAETKEDKDILRKNGSVVLYSKKPASGDSEFVGSPTFDSYGMVVSSRVRLDKFYAACDRTVQYICKFSSDCVAYFETVLFNDYSVWSTIVVNVSSKKFGLSTKTLQKCSFLNNSDEFMVSVTNCYQRLIVEITDLYTGKTAKAEYLNSYTGGGGSGGVEYEIANALPSIRDYYAFEKYSGTSFKISKIIVTCAKCDLLICGDSITQAHDYWPSSMYYEHWTQRIIQKTNGRAMVSARGGATIIQLQEWIENELPIIKPKYCMITIGSNGSNTKERLVNLVQYIKSQGVIPILNHIPCYNKNNTDTNGFIAINAVIDEVRSEESINGADMDIATSSAHDGQAVDTSTMWMDEYTNPSQTIYIHPNEKGSLLMFNRVLVDTPEIFI